MKIDNTSFFFNAPLAPGEKGGTSAWGTSAGQSKVNGYKIDLSKIGIQDLILGMNYCIKTDPENLDITSGSKTRELLLFSLFEKVYINGVFLEGVNFILLLIKEHSEKHDGRIIISYPPYATYKFDDFVIKNSESIVKMSEVINCPDGAWFAHDISVKNQDELHFSAIVLDKSIKVYPTSKARSNEWDLLLGDFNNTYLSEEEILHANIIYAYLKEGKSHRKIEKELLKVNNNGYATMNLLHIYNIDGKKKNILNISSFINEYNTSSDSYRNGLNLLASYYPDEFKIPKQGSGIQQIDFALTKFEESCIRAGLKFTPELLTRYISSLSTKPFVLLSGLSGSGKTKLAQAYAQWVCEDKSQYCIVPVGADWTNREPLLGYVNALNNTEYVLPENGALNLILEANKEENEKKPYFLILDEMNLSHVERYFADFLSVMESGDNFMLHSGTCNNAPVFLSWPKNLFVVGTVNIDETTYMFSPKVLDRANVIEFRISATEIGDYFKSTATLDMSKLCQEDSNVGLGASMGASFVSTAIKKDKVQLPNLNETLQSFFVELQKVGAEFGYRTASEIQTLLVQIDNINPEYKTASKENEKIDIAIMQKLLPKLHGSRSKLVPILQAIAYLCYDIKQELTKAEKESIFDVAENDTKTIKYPISLEKITRMHHNAVFNGFTSYAEA